MARPKWLDGEAAASPAERSTLPAYLDPNKTRVARSKKHEQRVAAEYGGRRLPASGALPFSRTDLNTSAADVVTPKLLIQHKGTERASIGVQREWLYELSVEARRRMKDPVLVITFEKERRFEDEWVLLPKSVYLRLKAAQEDEGEG